MEKGGNSGNIGARKPILALGELLVDLVPGREGMRIEDAGPVVKTASGSAGIFACAATLLGGRGGFIGKVKVGEFSQPREICALGIAIAGGRIADGPHRDDIVHARRNIVMRGVRPIRAEEGRALVLWRVGPTRGEQGEVCAG